MMHIDDFDFPLPRELIADRPCEPRDAARLLVIPAARERERISIGRHRLRPPPPPRPPPRHMRAFRGFTRSWVRGGPPDRGLLWRTGGSRISRRCCDRAT